jgi:hypothetical protein
MMSLAGVLLEVISAGSSIGPSGRTRGADLAIGGGGLADIGAIVAVIAVGFEIAAVGAEEEATDIADPCTEPAASMRFRSPFFGIRLPSESYFGLFGPRARFFGAITIGSPLPSIFGLLGPRPRLVLTVSIASPVTGSMTA